MRFSLARTQHDFSFRDLYSNCCPHFASFLVIVIGDVECYYYFFSCCSLLCLLLLLLLPFSFSFNKTLFILCANKYINMVGIP